MEIKFPRQIFEKTTNVKFHKNPSSGAELLHADGQISRHRHNESVAFRKFAKAPQIKDPFQYYFSSGINPSNFW
jgi:hypothetical protein